MEAFKAEVKEEDSRYYICIDLEGEVQKIPLSEDNPNDVKLVFNKLIKRLKSGKYEIKMEEIGDDLFSQVAKEYLGQLNRELQEVHKDLVHYGLVEEGKHDGAEDEPEKN